MNLDFNIKSLLTWGGKKNLNITVDGNSRQGYLKLYLETNCMCWILVMGLLVMSIDIYIVIL